MTALSRVTLASAGLSCFTLWLSCALCFLNKLMNFDDEVMMIVAMHRKGLGLAKNSSLKFPKFAQLMVCKYSRILIHSPRTQLYFMFVFCFYLYHNWWIKIFINIIYRPYKLIGRLMPCLAVLVGLLQLTSLYSSLKWNVCPCYIMAVRFVHLIKQRLGPCNMSLRVVLVKVFRLDLMISLLYVWTCSTAYLWPMLSQDVQESPAAARVTHDSNACMKCSME